jgi:hypothetical protein
VFSLTQSHFRWTGYVACTKREMRARISWKNPVGTRPVENPICRCEDNIKMDLRYIGWDGLKFINLSHDRDKRFL